ncbi:MAG: hypothetical protein WDO69_28525 [Pseudomonadota bacterium]
MSVTRTSRFSVLGKLGALVIALAIACLFSYLLMKPLPTVRALTAPSPRPDLLDRPHRPQGMTASRSNSN